MIKDNNVRLIITLDQKHLMLLSKLNELIGTKQNSKSVMFLLDYFYQIKKDE